LATVLRFFISSAEVFTLHSCLRGLLYTYQIQMSTLYTTYFQSVFRWGAGGGLWGNKSPTSPNPPLRKGEPDRASLFINSLTLTVRFPRKSRGPFMSPCHEVEGLGEVGLLIPIPLEVHRPQIVIINAGSRQHSRGRHMTLPMSAV